ncbi:MAG: uridine diphosphate-N-acetylglucosamine-binding protein YvcK [Pseudonocardiaceae bacterium]|nr:uridine diphosphate-N-acetylglucosamine-binding protein YvcK [Pseudonocardiaceae bacterium]
MRAVALGGGHGLYATLLALRELTDDVTAVVTVADDGGSSGRLRRELGVLPPGDLRMALAALAGADDGGVRWREVFQHRFQGNGALAGHAVGNLVLAGLLEVMGDPVAVLDEACRLLGVRGRVLPMAAEPLEIEADVSGLDNSDPDELHRIRGQVAVATTPGRVHRVRLWPHRPRACDEAVTAVREADLVVLGPGSWFTSVLPHLLVPELACALAGTAARKAVVLNLAPQPGETAGFSPQQHLQVLAEHAPAGFTVDAVLADTEAVTAPGGLHRHAAELGGHAYLDRVAAGPASDRHDPIALAAALHRILDSGPGRSADSAGGRGADGAPGSREREGEEEHRWP